MNIEATQQNIEALTLKIQTLKAERLELGSHPSVAPGTPPDKLIELSEAHASQAQGIDSKLTILKSALKAEQEFLKQLEAQEAERVRQAIEAEAYAEANALRSEIEAACEQIALVVQRAREVNEKLKVAGKPAAFLVSLDKGHMPRLVGNVIVEKGREHQFKRSPKKVA